MSMTNFLILFVAQYLIFFSVLVVPYLWWRREKHSLIRIVVTLIFAFAAAEALSHLFYVPRPFVAQGFMPLFPHQADGSFPSSHTTFLTALGGSVFFGERWLGIFLVLVGLIVGTARVLAGVHYPIDIIGGAALGVGMAVLVKFLHDKVSYW